MADLFCHCDDVWDAAADGARAINARLTRRGLQLDSASFEALRHTIADALGQAEVERVEG